MTAPGKENENHPGALGWFYFLWDEISGKDFIL
jgi:hypothetical protein